MACSGPVHARFYMKNLMKYGVAIFALLAMLAAGTPPAEAQWRGDRGGVQSLDRILDSIRRSRPGQLSDVQGPFGGVYRIKWLTPDGRVLWLETDAYTGQVIGVEGDDAPRGRGNFGGRNFRDDRTDEGRRDWRDRGDDWRGRGRGRFRDR
jgi:hypothetical protein